jgi:hypothetical protein
MGTYPAGILGTVLIIVLILVFLDAFDTANAGSIESIG